MEIFIWSNPVGWEGVLVLQAALMDCAASSGARVSQQMRTNYNLPRTDGFL